MQTGLAAGLVHSMMKKIISKGWVKAKQVSARRWLYYLTPEGFYEKSRLTMEFLSATITNYQKAQTLVQEQLAHCVDRGWRYLVVAGVNDLAHVTALNIKAAENLELVGVVSATDGNMKVAGVEPQPFEAIRGMIFDRVLVCDAAFLEWTGRVGVIEENGGSLMICNFPRD